MRGPVVFNTPSALRLWGRRFAKTLRPGDVVALIGSLGAGKTTLVQGISLGWGCRHKAVSPTFSLVNEYRSRRGNLFHMDMYRLSPRELLTFPLEDYLGQGLCLIEWADRIRARWPAGVIDLRLRITGPQRRSLTIRRATSPSHR